MLSIIQNIPSIIGIKAYFTPRNGLLSFVFATLFLFFTSLSATSQVKDTVAKIIVKADTVKYHSPKKATLMSTALPGLGQAYNKKYWKIPVIYLGLAGLIYSYNANQIKYVTYRDAYKYSVDNDPSTVNNYAGVYSETDIFTLQKTYNRRRDLSVIGIALVYVLNIVDACVDAHMYTFDVSDDLTFNIYPTLINTANSNQYNTGFSLNIKF